MNSYLLFWFQLCSKKKIPISYYTMDNQCCAASTAGAQPNPLWLRYFVNQKFEIVCGFDADQKGDKIAKQMISLYPIVKRLRPHKHDWNDVLTTKSKNQHSSHFFLPSIENNLSLNKNYLYYKRKEL